MTRFQPKLIALSALAVSLFTLSPAHAASLRDMLRELSTGSKSGSTALDSGTIAEGLKEALSVGAKNSVALVSKPDGYFGNSLIRIQTPEKIQKMERLMRKAGMDREVDRFIVTMNRAAEKAAPQALGFFLDAVREMTIPDALKILKGRDTEATEFLKSRTYDRIFETFKPVVNAAMNDVGVTRSFKEMMDKARKISILRQEAVDLDEYVTAKALDGLFLTVGQEEQKIRKDPAARVTDLLKKVFQ